jgi:tetratricopeptide (TPR) repeat protein
MFTEMGGVVKATKKLGMVVALLAFGAVMTACASGKSIKQGNEEFSISEAKYHEALAAQDNSQEYFEAIRAWSKVLEDEPRFAQAHFNLGVIYDKLNMVPEAMEHYELAVQYLENSLEVETDETVEPPKDSAAALALYNLHLGAAYLRGGLIDEAEVALLEASKGDQWNPTVHYNLAACYMAQNHYDKGLIHADIAVDLYAKPDSKNTNKLSNDVDAERLGKYVLRQAECHLALREWEKARVALNRAKDQCHVDVPAALWAELEGGEEQKEMESEEGGETEEG